MSVAGSVIVCKGLRFLLRHSLELTVIALSACALQHDCQTIWNFLWPALKFSNPLFSKMLEFQGLSESSFQGL